MSVSAPPPIGDEPPIEPIEPSPGAKPKPPRQTSTLTVVRQRLPPRFQNFQRPEWFDRLLADPIGRVVLVVAVIGVCGLGVLVCFNLTLLLQGTLGPSIAFGRTPTLPAPTPFESGDALVSSSSVEVPLSVPQTLKFAGESYPVSVVTVGESGEWTLPASQAPAAYWVYGTLVNYVFGLRDTRENLASIDALAKGDTLEVQMSDGRVLRFQVSQKLSVPVDQTGIFSQTEPGLTMVLVGGRDETRLAIEALFVGQSGGPSEAGVAEIYELGEPAQAGDLTVTVTATKLVTFGAAELPSGLAYYLVDFVVENTGPGPIEASLVATELIDSTDAHYAPVIPVSAVTTYPPLAGRINPNDVINASAAYLVATNFSDVGALWRFSAGGGANAAAVQINLASPVLAGPAVNVTLKSATVDPSTLDLILSGTVVSLADSAIAVSETDVSLVTGTGQVGRLLRATPPFPWTLDPAAFLSYEIVFERPATTSVVFRLLGWEFELTGID